MPHIRAAYTPVAMKADTFISQLIRTVIFVNVHKELDELLTQKTTRWLVNTAFRKKLTIPHWNC